MPILFREGNLMKYAYLAISAIIFTVPFFVQAETKKPVDGYSGVKWGVNMSEAKKGLRGKIVFDDEKRIIVTRDGEITYRYGFFYKAPLAENASPSTAPTAAPQIASTAAPVASVASPAPSAAVTPVPTAAPVQTDKKNEPETRLFYVITEFPYISLEDIRGKMTAEYGEPTGDTITKAQGAVVWDSGKGVVIVWVDAYEKNPYVRKISYLSKDIAKEIKENLTKEFNKRELDVIKRLVP
jgi:hypothetical protein